MLYAGPVVASFRQTAGLIAGGSAWSVLFNAIPLVLVAGWIAARAGDPSVVAHVAIGAFFVVLWHNAVFRMGWSVADEAFAGTLELNVVTRTPLVVTMLGKALAFTAYSGAIGVAGFVGVLLIHRGPLVVAEPLALVASVAVGLVAVFSLSFIFAPGMVLLRGSGGFYNGLRPLVILLSGFLHPVSLLPGWLQAVAWLLPTAWAMDAVVGALGRSDVAVASIPVSLTASLGLSFLYLGLTYWLFLVVERRLRKAGSWGGL